MTATSSLARARAREHMTKDASFMTGARRFGSGVATRVGSIFRRRPDVSGATRGVRSMLTKDFDRRLLDARMAKVKARGKTGLLKKLRTKMRNPLSGAGAETVAKTPAKAVKKGMGLGKKVMIGAGLLGAGATIGGGMSAAKIRAQQPLAPPEMVPPGY